MLGVPDESDGPSVPVVVGTDLVRHDSCPPGARPWGTGTKNSPLQYGEVNFTRQMQQGTEMPGCLLTQVFEVLRTVPGK